MAGAGVVTPENEQPKKPPPRPLVVGQWMGGTGWLGWIQNRSGGRRIRCGAGSGEVGWREKGGAVVQAQILASFGWGAGAGGGRRDGDCVVEVEASCFVSCLVGAFSAAVAVEGEGVCSARRRRKGKATALDAQSVGSTEVLTPTVYLSDTVQVLMTCGLFAFFCPAKATCGLGSPLAGPHALMVSQI